MKNYIKNIRRKIGNEKFIHPAARIIIENNEDEILFVKRQDNGKLGIPAGAIEENETIEECIKREVYEETGLNLIDIKVIGISSNPSNETVIYPNGDTIQYFTIEFYSNKYDGEIKPQDSVEIKSAGFLNQSFIEELPRNEKSAFESLEHFKKYKSIMVK